jgi:hypothetical protein
LNPTPTAVPAPNSRPVIEKFFASPDGSNTWRIVRVGPKVFIERETTDATGGDSWVPEANFETSIENQNWIAALVSLVTKNKPQPSVLIDATDNF